MTLIERSVWEKLGDHHEADDVVWGMAYRIPAAKVDSAKEYVFPRAREKKKFKKK